MRFDENAPGGGVEAVYRLENGKAFLEWKLYFAEDGTEQGRNRAEDEGDWEETEPRRSLDGAETGSDGAQTGRSGMETGRDGTETEPDGKTTGRGQSRGAMRGMPGVPVGARISIYVTDREGNQVLECRQQLREEEPLQSILLQPRLWRGTEEPYLYDMEAILEDGSGCRRDRVRGHLPLRSLDSRQPGSLTLNGAALEPRAVRYYLPDMGGVADSCHRMEKDLRLLLELGANCVCLDGWEEGQEGNLERGRFFLALCDGLGLLAFRRQKGGSEYVWIQGDGRGAGMIGREAVAVTCGGEVPVLRSRKKDVAVCGERGAETLQADALLPDGEHPGPYFYRCLAEWGRKPFVYIVPESVRKMESGNYTALCYSNCDRVALYSDGNLFEFQRGEREFYFQEIPAKSPCIMLAAEGEGCGASLSVHKSFVKQWENEGIWH